MTNKQLLITYPYELNGADIAVYAYLYGLHYNRYLPSKVYTSASILSLYTGLSIPEVKGSLAKMDEVALPLKNGIYEITLKKLFQSKKDFVSIPFKNISQILKIKNNSRYKILKFFALILKSVDYRIKYVGDKGFLSHMSIGYFAKVMGVSAPTIIKWEGMLEELGIIYVFRSSDVHTPNYVGLAQYKNSILEFANGHGKYERRAGQDETVSVLQKYNALCAGATYTNQEFLEIYNGISSYNKNHPDKARDLSIFKDILDKVSD